MSKEAALRAMREARYRERSASSAGTSTPAKPTAKAAAKPTAKPTESPTAGTPAPATPTDGLCGHRSMNGRTCTREHGHAAKSHRYS